MGGTTFGATWYGKDAETAFYAAQEQARYEHGHGGYTGTIAEMRGFVELVPPSGVSTKRGAAFVQAATERLDIDVNHPWGVDAIRRFKQTVPKDHRGWAIGVARSVADKWGPCLCVEITNARDVRDLRRRFDVAGRRGIRFFHFAGWASC